MNTLKFVFKKLIPTLRILLALVVGVFAYLNYTSIGFLDGHLTAYDRFLKSTFYPAFFVLNALFILIFFWLLFRQQKGNVALVLYIAFIVMSVLVSHYFSITLENGQGG